MIDCLYTGPATDSIDCWWGDRVRSYISVPWHARDEIIESLNKAEAQEIVPLAYDRDNPLVLPYEAFDWKKPAKAPESLQDILPEKG